MAKMSIIVTEFVGEIYPIYFVGFENVPAVTMNSTSISFWDEHRVVRQKSTDLSENRSVSILKAEE
jgi:hypothetical protein